MTKKKVGIYLLIFGLIAIVAGNLFRFMPEYLYYDRTVSATIQMFGLFGYLVSIAGATVYNGYAGSISAVVFAILVYMIESMAYSVVDSPGLLFMILVFLSYAILSAIITALFRLSKRGK